MDIPLLERLDLVPDFNTALQHRQGLVGASVDLSVSRLLAYYPQGMFPWHSDDDYFYWFTVAPRMVLYPSALHLSRSLAKNLRNKPYLVSSNHDFETVLAACAQTPRSHQSCTWIGADFQRAYARLHQAGHAHSFECWMPNPQGEAVLAGGLYGVQIGRVFFGESMFAWQNDASKIAFAWAVPFLAERGVALIDCQLHSDHLARFGAHTMALVDFQVALQHYTVQPLSQPIGKHLIHSQF